MKSRAHEDVRAYTIKDQGGSLRRGMPLFYVRIAVEKIGTGSRPHALWGSFARRGELRMTTLKKATRTRTPRLRSGRAENARLHAITNQQSKIRNGFFTSQCGCVGTGRR